MPRNRRKRRIRRATSPGRTPLRLVKQLKHRGKYFIRDNAFQDARKDFGWDTEDIVDALNKLQNKHYHKTKPSNIRPGVMMDFYHASGLKGENVYIHFYVDPNGKLVINSLKRMQ
jgi:hypothetical protein